MPPHAPMPQILTTHIIWPPPGRYILAVSGGADSMAMLDLFAPGPKHPKYEVVVAHFDHGLRPDSGADRTFVEAAAHRYNLPFIYYEANLGQGRDAHTSEATARIARHAWLEQMRVSHKAAAILLGHHQDDLIETSLLNLARGSGRRGLAPMHPATANPPAVPASPVPTLLRPLLRLTRADLRAYAAQHHLQWHEDPTNADTSNPRNFLRHRLLSAATPDWREQYLSHLNRLAALNSHIDPQIQALLRAHRTNASTFTFPQEFIRDTGPAELAEVFLAAAQTLSPGIELSHRLLNETVMFAKIGTPGSHRPLRQGLKVTIDRAAVELNNT